MDAEEKEEGFVLLQAGLWVSGTVLRWRDVVVRCFVLFGALCATVLRARELMRCLIWLMWLLATMMAFWVHGLEDLGP